LKQLYTIRRFPSSKDKSLRAWSAADEHILNRISKEIDASTKISIFNDLFGYLSIHLNNHKPKIFTHFKSQEEAILQNFELNKKDSAQVSFLSLLSEGEQKSEIVIMKIPKSMDLFHLFLMKAHEVSRPDTKVFCGFMTRHFTQQMIDLALCYFDIADQSLAWKKSRVLELSSPKEVTKIISPIHSITFMNHRGEQFVFQQYYGVFSSRHIDYATQFLLENLKIDGSVGRVLDLASGNGVIAHEISKQAEKAAIHLMDDSLLAIESSKLNLWEGDLHFHYHHTLDHFEDAYFDLVVSNPPFHFEHENTMDIALRLFEGVARVLRRDGSFILVANLHLNYKTHLTSLFSNVRTVKANEKFEVIECHL
jgi:16S rRNA G1207 methylase RsmC